MKEIKLSNIQKESEKIKIKKAINDCEDFKAQLLLNLGIMTFDKIRKGEIIDEDFDSLCDEIKNLDIEIYTKYMQLRSFENENKRITCDCGYVAFKNEKFCPQCGKSLIEKEKRYITCSSCHQETEDDSNFCACCGSKIKQDSIVYDEEVYCIEDDLYMDNSIEEEIPEVDMIEEDFGQEFLKEKEALDSEEYEEIDKYAVENDSLEIRGREFLKNNQENMK